MTCICHSCANYKSVVDERPHYRKCDKCGKTFFARPESVAIWCSECYCGDPPVYVEPKPVEKPRRMKANNREYPGTYHSVEHDESPACFMGGGEPCQPIDAEPQSKKSPQESMICKKCGKHAWHINSDGVCPDCEPQRPDPGEDDEYDGHDQTIGDFASSPLHGGDATQSRRVEPVAQDCVNCMARGEIMATTKEPVAHCSDPNCQMGGNHWYTLKLWNRLALKEGK